MTTDAKIITNPITISPGASLRPGDTEAARLSTYKKLMIAQDWIFFKDDTDFSGKAMFLSIQLNSFRV